MAKLFFGVNRPPLITAAELLALQSSSNGKLPCAVVDASWYLPAMCRSAENEYSQKRIPKAQFWGIDTVADKTSKLPHMLPSEAEFGSHMARMGIADSSSPVVVYDGHGFFSSPRAWWSLGAFGHRNAVILEGGLPAWEAAGGQVETGPAQAASTPQAQWKLDPGWVCDASDVMGGISARRAATGSGVRYAPLLVDARPAGRFSGSDPEPRAGLKSGHAPLARNVPFSSLLDPARHNALLPPDLLHAALLRAGVDPSRPGPIVTSCGSGVTAAVIFAALMSLGRPTGSSSLSLYDGSWADWGSLDGCEIVNGPPENAPASDL